MAILKDLIVHGSSRFLNKIYASEIQTPLIEAEAGIIKKLKADDATIVGLLDVQGQLHTNSWTNSNIATIDGSFYITPTLTSSSGSVSFTSATAATFTGTYSAVSSLYIGNKTSSTVQWSIGSKLLITGEVQVDGEWIPLGTLLAILNANNPTSSMPVIEITDNRHTNPSSIVADIYSRKGNVSLNYRNLKISLYQRKYDSHDFPLGIYMTALSQNGKTFLDIYGGVNSTETASYKDSNNNNVSNGGFADPNVRIGNLAGIKPITTAAGIFTPQGWGIYTINGYFQGTIVSDSGVIGGWRIGDNSLYNGTTGLNNNTVGIYLGTDGIRNYSTSTQYVNITGGKITAQGVDLTGEITASSGSIGGWNIGTDTNKSLYYGNQTPGATTTNLILSPTSATNSNAIGGSGTGLTWFISAGKVFGVTTAGALYATSGKIGGWTLNADGFYITNNIPGYNANTLVISKGTASTNAIGGSDTTSKNWMISAGTGFGVTTAGVLYANDVHISGEITATDGTIGGINIVDGALDVSSINIGDLSGEIGGINLIINTLNPSTTAANRPKIIGQTVNTIGRGTASVAEHGIRFTTTSASYCYIYMGFTALTTGEGATLQGLTAGETYTFSCDFTCKIFSADTSTTTRYLRFYVYDDTSGSFALDKYQNMIDLDTSKKGTEQSGHFYYTFTLPTNITKFGFMVRTNVTTSGLFTTGEFIELRNIKLEKGSKATDWSPAPKDVTIAASYITQIDSTGIKITPYDKSGNDYLQLNSDAINMYRNNIETLRIEDNAIRIGKSGEGQKNVYIDNDSIDIRDNENILASFTGEDIKFYDGQIKGLEIASFGGANGVRIGNEEETHFVINNSAVKALNNNGSTIFSIGTTDTLIGNTVKVFSGETVPNEGYSITLNTNQISLSANDEFYIERIILKLKVAASGFDEDGIICQNFQVNQTNPEITLLNHTTKGNPGNFTTISNFIVYLSTSSNVFKYGTASSLIYSLNGTFSYYNGSSSYTGQIRITYDGSNTLTFNSVINSSSFGDNKFTLISDEESDSFYRYSDVMVSNKTSYAPVLTFGTRVGYTGPLSTVIGESLYASERGQMSIGRFNKLQPGNIFAVGKGENDANRQNAFTVSSSGNVDISGDVHFSGNIYKGTSPLFYFKEWTWNISSIAKNSGWYGPSGNDTPATRQIAVTGYTPIAIAGYNIWGGTNPDWCIVPRLFINQIGTEQWGNPTPAMLQMYIWNQNTNAAATNIKFTVEILYIASNCINQIEV